MHQIWKTIFSVFILFALIICQYTAAAQSDLWPRRVLITNDNGINDIKIIELALAFSKVAETVVVAPMEDRSGASNYMPVFINRQVRVEARNLGDNITAYAVDGYPGDCVLLALTGIMRENPPDLVVSGINGGPNLGQDWFGSGTIGAARVASFAGVPAIAVSGLNDDLPGSVRAVNEWVVQFVQSEVVRSLQWGQYLTVSIPRIPPDEIKGVRITKRAGLRRIPVMTQSVSDSSGVARSLWQMTGVKETEDETEDPTDISWYEAGFIAVVPMNAREQDHSLSLDLINRMDQIPDWPGLNNMDEK